MERIAKSYILPDTFCCVPKLLNYVHLGSLRNYGKGEMISQPGEVIGKVIFVLSGKLATSRITDDGREVFVCSGRQHSVINRLFEFEGDNVQIVAIEASKICFFSEEQMLMIFKHDEKIISDFLYNESIKLNYFIKLSCELKLYTPSVRVLRLFYGLYNLNGQSKDTYWEIQIALPNKVIAEITGLHHVTVSKILGSLKKEKILSKKKNAIIIYNLEKLKDLVDKGIAY
ncbi:Crp/Fnr family transcriptional regulator [Dehalobacter sp. 14DCB1]|uniref:Crp/Fnr family transcriptional regulator n=1 Tax=Dehalobacter sp. 14DCB1 TaxID=2070227 RepID=UPI0003A8178D|nr:Crp/Fnr family transcriptional regulator [Dehalobacter sp. 14DCB1]TCX51673.1 Crp/Fnr family transcriptional regulator [Dehalobacter sp. 14DCB1]